MAVIDPAREDVVIRVVYDGPPMAGKTTSVRALANCMGGALATPHEIDGRTLYFDWLDYTGGLFDGRRIRCQIISVPGQATLAARRRRLLETADVVVFVGDSAKADQSATKSYLTGLRQVLDGLEGPTVGIVLQANKRDQPDAVPIADVRAMLDSIGGRIGLVESVAIDGSGVRETFVFAVRLALDRVRELMRTGQLRTIRPEVDSADELLQELRRTEGSALDMVADSALTHTRMSEVRQPTSAQQALQQVVRENDPAVYQNPSALLEKHSTRHNSPDAQADAAHDMPSLPGGDLPSGMIWPPVNGRLILHEATATSINLKRLANGDWEGAAGTHWRLQSPMGARFETLDAGRDALMHWARLHAASAHVLSPQRCILLCRDGPAHYRLWQLVHIGSSLRDEFNATLSQGPAMMVRGLLTITRAFLLAADRFASAACWLPLSLRKVGMSTDGTCFLGYMPDPTHTRAPTPRTPAETLQLLSVQLEYALADLEACRLQALVELEQLIGKEGSFSMDATHVFARRLLSEPAT